MEPILTREQIRKVDGIAIEELGIPGVVLMENAGRNAAGQIRYRVRARQAARAVIFCGSGNNGGDGFVISRQLANAGIDLLIFLTGDPERLSPDCAVNYNIVKKMGLEVSLIDSVETARQAAAALSPDDIAVDALLGTGFTGEVRPPLSTLIKAINKADKSMTVAIDVPSGLDCNTGQPANATIKADLTITFGANKVGLIKPDAHAYVGEVAVADIGAPPSLIERVQAST
jgi:NAD(P)H-hydrate epimerase